MNSVVIDGQKVSTYDAIMWASKNFGQTFHVQSEFPGWQWHFKFDKPEQASLFALKWIR
jgi:hypothetical protein